MDKVRVPVVEDGLGYEERFVFAYLSWKSVRGRVALEGSISSLAEEMRIDRVKSLSKNLKSLEGKGLIKLMKTREGRKQVLREIKLRGRGYDRVRGFKRLFVCSFSQSKGISPYPCLLLKAEASQ
ncbi:MAG: hypothetical protein Q9N34_06700 [Aquificota bacterium]|nr:hypothetical protein [Aquificota bacterium]